MWTLCRQDQEIHGFRKYKIGRTFSPVTSRSGTQTFSGGLSHRKSECVCSLLSGTGQNRNHRTAYRYRDQPACLHKTVSHTVKIQGSNRKRHWRNAGGRSYREGTLLKVEFPNCYHNNEGRISPILLRFQKPK